MIISICIAVYLLLGFATLVLDSHQSTVENSTLARVAIFMFWPVPVSVFVVALIWVGMDKAAAKIAKRLKRWAATSTTEDNRPAETK